MDRSRPTLSRRRKVAGEGEPEVYAADEQGIGVDMMRWVGLARRVLISEGVRGNAELNMLFVDEASIAELNESFLDKQGSTDVLAFPIDGELDIATAAIATGPGRAHPDLDDLPLLLGDVVICPAVALAQACDHAGTFDDEMALLCVHGALHVLGYDHEVAEDGERMRQRELDLLIEHHWHGPAPDGFRRNGP